MFEYPYHFNTEVFMSATSLSALAATLESLPDPRSKQGVSHDASQGGFVEGDGGRCALFTEKGSSIARLSTQVSV